jgi:hypothetical protein
VLGVLGVAAGVWASRNSSGDAQTRPAASTAQAARGTTQATTTRRSRPAKRPPPPRTIFGPADRASFQSLERSLGGTSGLAASAVGFNRPITQFGTLREGVAWSTIKVPIALAVEARFGGAPPVSTQELLARAITASDNNAAWELWGTLGSPDVAGATVQRVLASSGDGSTSVETRVLRQGYTSFGQTNWSLSAQQRFIAALPCLANSRPVLSLMQQVEADQRWGLGTLGTETQLKGGWGPDPSGRYLVRQMGIVRLSNGRLLAASIATIPPDGSFATGTANLNEIARWLASHAHATALLPVRC